jgi:hypothetical protein
MPNSISDIRINVPISQYRDQLKTRKYNNQIQIWDPFRKKWYLLTKEEMIRQLLLIHLVEGCGFPQQKISIERSIRTLGMEKRFDILIYDDNFNPWMLIECKSPEWKIDQSTIDQIGIYNVDLKAPYLLITNGNVTLCCEVNQHTGMFNFLKNIPQFEKKP